MTSIGGFFVVASSRVVVRFRKVATGVVAPPQWFGAFGEFAVFVAILVLCSFCSVLDPGWEESKQSPAWHYKHWY